MCAGGLDSKLVYLRLDDPKSHVSTPLQTVETKAILQEAIRMFHVHGRLIQDLGSDEFAECSLDTVPNGSRLRFQPQYHEVKFQFRTLNRTKSLRLLAKHLAKQAGGLDGFVHRVDGISVSVVARWITRDRLDSFLRAFQDHAGIEISDSTAFSIGYGVLHRKFQVNSHDGIVRNDGQDSFDRDEDAKSESSGSIYS